MADDARVLKLAKDMASYVHHSGFPVYDGGHAEPESACPHPDCVAVREADEEGRELAAKIQYLVDWADAQHLLEEHVFTFPDGDTWEAKR